MKKSVKRGEEVVVITGAYKGKRGKVLEVFPRRARLVVEGVALAKRHLKKTQENPTGGIIEREAAIHVSNVMSAERYDLRQSKKTESKR